MPRFFLDSVRLALAGFMLHVSDMLEALTRGFEDIPFFGTMADVNFIAERQAEPFIFDGHRLYTHGVTFLLFMGEELHVDAEYIFGWKPIGKAMPVTISNCAITAGDTPVSAIDGVEAEKTDYDVIFIDHMMPEMDGIETLREAYEFIREIAANLDSDSAAYALNYLSGFRIPDDERERVEKLRRAISSFDWDGIGAILGPNK